ncbi:MAG: hypothetical protein ABIS27_00100 [Longimicrobiales bacterium]
MKLVRESVAVGVFLLSFGVAACGSNAASGGRIPATPQAAVDELLAADRAFSKASGGTDVVTGISAMFAPDVATTVPGGLFSTSAAEAVASLRAYSDRVGERAAEWTPIRGGISADGMHGFTFGFMEVRTTEGKVTPMKYLSYWVKRPEGWRVAVYRRRTRGAGAVSTLLLPPALPARMVSPKNVSADILQSIDAAERSFSLESQTIGLNAAFTKFGSDDAINMGGADQPSFTFGAAAIGRAVGQDEPAGTGSTVHWAPDRVLAASSGDLGVTIGAIHPNTPNPDGSQAAGFPFFTVWRRASPGAPWRYIAE